MIDEIKSLALLFQPLARLYLVGGYVRCQIMGLHTDDIDVASALTPDEVSALLHGTPFSVKLINPAIGTVLITGRDCAFEHTTFRLDSYTDGNHTPDTTIFVGDITVDARRRDFTINAIYYDILLEKYIDFFDGMSDIRHGYIRALPPATFTFADDGLRLMRLVRLACELDFTIERQTLIACQLMSVNLADISKPRLRQELTRILHSAHKYPIALTKCSPERGIMLLFELGMAKYIFPNISLAHRPKFRFLKKLTMSPLLSLLCDLSKITDYTTDQLVDRTIGSLGLQYDSATIVDSRRCLAAISSIKGEPMNAWLLRHWDIVPKIMPYINMNTRRICSKLSKLYNQKLLTDAPSTLKELNLSPTEILRAFPDLQGSTIGETLARLLQHAFDYPEDNEKSKLLQTLHQWKKEKTSGNNTDNT